MAMSPLRLVITADDFGMAPAVNEAVEQAHRYGVLSAASLMVGAPAAADAVQVAKRSPDLRIGLHLVLVEGRPVLPAARVPHLVDAEGRFRPDMARAGATMFFHPAARGELAAEIEAQFSAFVATGLTLDHVNAHKHFHLHPTITGLILSIGARHGLRAVRAPVEPAKVLRMADPGGVIGFDPLVQAFARLTRARVRAAGLIAPDYAFGLHWSGAMTAARLAALILALPPGLSEIYLHPATDDDFDGAASGYGYAGDLAALTSPSVALALSRRGIRPGGFADFVP